MAAEAKEIYSKYWTDYWEFAILRNTVYRFISMLKYKEHFGVTVNVNGELDISGCLQKFSTDQEIIIDYDYRFTSINRPNDLAIRFDYSYKKGAIHGKRSVMKWLQFLITRVPTSEALLSAESRSKSC